MTRHRQPHPLYTATLAGLLLLLATGCGSRQTKTDRHQPPFSCRVIQVSGGYGYVVMQDCDTLIRQPFIPAMKGRQPFNTKAEAERVGRLVCDKMTAGSPPTLSIEEVENCLLQTKE